MFTAKYRLKDQNLFLTNRFNNAMYITPQCHIRFKNRFNKQFTVCLSGLSTPLLLYIPQFPVCFREYVGEIYELEY
jgi:hypothetical protein